MTGAKPWIEELWSFLIAQALGEEPPEPEWLSLPALGRITVTRPELLKPFAEHNRRRPDHAVRPHNFISVTYPKVFSTARDLRLFAPYVSDPREALESLWYEMRSGEEVRVTTKDLGGEIGAGLVAVKSYGDVAREYAAHPEAKFAAPDGGHCLRTTSGTLKRRHVSAERAEYIGKEGNLLQQRVEGVGLSVEAQAVYEDPTDFERRALPILRAAPLGELAASAGLSERALRDILSLRSRPRAKTRSRLSEIARQHA